MATSVGRGLFLLGWEIRRVEADPTKPLTLYGGSPHRCGTRMPLTPLNECSSAVTRSSAHNVPWRYQLVLPAKKGAQGMIVKHKLPYAIKKRNATAQARSH
jgi:hypothetical protein